MKQKVLSSDIGNTPDLSVGWMSRLAVSPEWDDVPIEITRARWVGSVVICEKDLCSDDNLSGLYWRPTGIYRERMSKLPVKAVGGMRKISNKNISSMLGSVQYRGLESMEQGFCGTMLGIW